LTISFVSPFKFSYLFLEMKDESDTATSNKKKSTGRKGKTADTSKKQSENAENVDPTKDDLNLSEGEESADDKEDTTTTKKGPTKRSAPSSDKKTGTTTSKKRSAEDEPFEDRTNENDNAEAEFNSEDG
jgi:hypothetical protein